MSQSLNLRTVAEGIESSEQVARLRELGCDIGQGYFYSRPVPVEGIEPLLERGLLGEGSTGPRIVDLASVAPGKNGGRKG